jgi:hypothetical protein
LAWEELDAVILVVHTSDVDTQEDEIINQTALE